MKRTAQLAAAALLVLAALPSVAEEKRNATANDFQLPDYSWLNKLDTSPAAKPAALPQSNAPAPPARKLQVHGTAVQYQVNKRLSVEAGYRGGLLSAPATTPVSPGQPASSPGAFIRFKRSFSAD